MDKSKSVISETVNNRFNELLGEGPEFQSPYKKASIVVEGSVFDTWLEDLEWHFLHEMEGDYGGIEADEAANTISFNFADKYALKEAQKFINNFYQKLIIVE